MREINLKLCFLEINNLLMAELNHGLESSSLRVQRLSWPLPENSLDERVMVDHLVEVLSGSERGFPWLLFVTRAASIGIHSHKGG